MFDVQIGIVAEIQARRARVVGANPRLAHRILGTRKPYLPPKTHRITVNCATGERTIAEGAPLPPPTTAPRVFTPHPRPVDRRLPEPPAKSPDLLETPRREFIRIIRVVAETWGIQPNDIVDVGRLKAFVLPRYAAIRLVAELLPMSTPRIGRLFGGRDHTTILSARRRAAGLFADDADWRARYDAAHAALTGGAC